MTKKEPKGRTRTKAADQQCGLFQALLLMAEAREPTSEEGFAVTIDDRRLPRGDHRLELVAALRDGRIVARGKVTARGLNPRPTPPGQPESECTIPREYWATGLVDFRHSMLSAYWKEKNWGANFENVRVNVSAVRAILARPLNDIGEKTRETTAGRKKKVSDDELYLAFIAMLRDHIDAVAKRHPHDAGAKFPHQAEAIDRLSKIDLQPAHLKTRLAPIYGHLAASKEANAS